MKKHILTTLLIGAVAMLSTLFVTSCNKQTEELNTRVTVLEGMVKDLEQQIKAAVVTGSTITSATQDAQGVWTIVLSNGQTITINPSQGGGSTVTVEETAEAFIISIDGRQYVIPKTSSAFINSMVFVPEFEDGFVFLNNDGADAKFLATPAVSSSDLAEATIQIADVRELKTRGGESLLKVESAAVDGEYIAIHIKGLGVEKSKKYSVALRITIKGTTISSNYFTVQVSDDFGFDPEVLVDPEFIDGVEVTKLEGELDGFWKALVPNSAITYTKETDLKSFFKTLPAGNIQFVLGPEEQQNDNVKGRYQAFKDFLGADGVWKPTYRLATDAWGGGNGPTDRNGFLVYVTANDVIKHKIYFQIDNFVPGMGLDKFLGEGYPEAQHIEIGVEESVNMKWIVPAGASIVDLSKILLTATFPEGELLPDPIYLRHGDANKAIHMVQEASLEWGGDIVLGNDGSHFYLDGKLKEICAFSRGLCWRTTQPSWVSSIRENWSEEQKALCNGPANGEILGGWDGGGDIPGLMGWEMNENGLVFSDKYEGWGFRSGVGMYLETFYTNDQQVGPWHWFYMFFNRRVAPYEEGKGIDPDAR